MAVIIRVISAFLTVLMLPLYALTSAVDLIPADRRSEEMSVNIAGIGAYFRSQGVATDGEYLYFSSKTTLYKTDITGRNFVDINLDAIGPELKEKGIKHIGGISYYNGFIYAGMEDSKVWNHPVVGVFSADTLTLAEYYELDSSVHTRGLPWVCVNPENGLLYAFDHSKTPGKILAYSVNDGMKPADEIPLCETVKSVQGAEFYEGMLYAATNDETQAVYAVNVETGEVEKITDRNLPGGEGEGMTVVTKDGRPYILAFDLGPLFVNTNLRYYPLDN
ncbi:MAG: hypothetical protein IK085_09720 [Clostridia bacterium]|nr:hypothetical protein [Clostridia bacterium]